ncbi:putative aconitase subunit 2 [Kribbella antiqua]|uniref:Putative aconitase subunit 2 n=1 Tax=Kribbella antiqua TaxID=2512217 RepID=A0A4R2I477_9ACTN|nr:DUF126 domain-containing protein [Kribbella antiqua]TCO38981.1 putative aconitase subunit 2 [Kribbella antiqua]
MIQARTLTPGTAVGEAIRLTAPLSFWGGTDDEGRIIDAHHPQCGEVLAGRVLVMESGRGSSSASSVLAEQIRASTAPAAIILARPDTIIALGALVAQELYGLTTPVVVTASYTEIPDGRRVQVHANPDRAIVSWSTFGQ